jgi:4-amino-4-deoxy-L-arabinose transferase-like glycosyltransferase
MRTLWVAAVILGLAVLSLGALAVTWTIPLQEWDAYSSGTWAVLIAHGSPLLPPEVDRILRQRPLVYVVEGLIWRAIGSTSMRAARIYSLLFSVLLAWATYLVAQALGPNRARSLLATFVAASPLVTEQVSSTLSDIPATALVWLGFWVSTKAAPRKRAGLWILAGILFSVALLAKVTVCPLILILIAIAAMPSLRDMSRRDVAVAVASLAAPGLLVLSYFNYVRAGVKWGFFLFGWAGRYYASLAGLHWISNLEHPEWFGVFLTVGFLVALATYLLRAFARRTPKSGVIALIFAFVAVYVSVGTWGLTTPLRPYGSPKWDRWLAGFPEVLAILAIGLFFLVRRFESGKVFGRELLIPVAVYGVLWWWKLGYDRRFLVVILPAVCIFVAGWLSVTLDRILAERRTALFGCALAFLLAMSWEGGKKMDHGYPVFSRAMVGINRKDGLEPEAKLIDIFGDEARVMLRLQDMVRADPELSLVSPDNRLKFHLGPNVTIDYVQSPTLGMYDVLVWTKNPGVAQQYAQSFLIPDPLLCLKEGGRLSLLFSGGDYEVYRIGAPASAPEPVSAPTR